MFKTDKTLPINQNSSRKYYSADNKLSGPLNIKYVLWCNLRGRCSNIYVVTLIIKMIQNEKGMELKIIIWHLSLVFLF